MGRICSVRLFIPSNLNLTIPLIWTKFKKNLFPQKIGNRKSLSLNAFCYLFIYIRAIESYTCVGNIKQYKSLLFKELCKWTKWIFDLLQAQACNIDWRRQEKISGVQVYGRPRRVPGAAPRTQENFRKFAKKSLRKLQEMQYFRLFCKKLKILL